MPGLASSSRGRKSHLRTTNIGNPPNFYPLPPPEEKKMNGGGGNKGEGVACSKTCSTFMETFVDDALGIKPRGVVVLLEISGVGSAQITRSSRQSDRTKTS